MFRTVASTIRAAASRVRPATWGAARKLGNVRAVYDSSFAAQKFRDVANGVVELAIYRRSLQNRALLITSKIERGAHQGWSSAAIKEVASLFRR